MSVRSQRLGAPRHLTTANSDTVHYVVPAGRTLILRSWSVWNGGAAARVLLEVTPAEGGSTAPIGALHPAASDAAQNDTWVVFNPEDEVVFQADNTSCWVTIFGSLLDGEPT